MQRALLRIVVSWFVLSPPTGALAQQNVDRVLDDAAAISPEFGQPLALKLKELEQAFMVRFMYDPEVVNNKMVAYTPVSGSLDEQLKEILIPLDLAFEKIENGYFAIAFATEFWRKTGALPNGTPLENSGSVRLEDQQLNTGTASKEKRIARGRVITADSGMPVPAASVMVKGTNVAAITDAAGEFHLPLPKEGSTLVVSYIGYLPKETRIDNTADLVISLNPETKELGQVVVTGYASTPMKDVTGAVATVRSEDIARLPVLSVDQALQGRAAGVFVSNSHANPGGETNVRIRGTNSVLGNNEPLYVIDGFIGGDIHSVSPHDIESIDVLKDASSTAIFGTRGSNGVVMITTRRGGKQGRRITLDSFYGFQTISRKMSLMNAHDYAQYINRIDTERGRQLKYPDPDNLEFDTDWQDEIVRTAPWQQHSVSIGGETAELNYYVSGAYAGQQGIVEATGYKRFNGRANIETHVSDRVRVGTRLGWSHINRTLQEGEEIGRRDDTGHPVARALMLAPTIASRDSGGEILNTITDHNGILRANPLFALKNTSQHLATGTFIGNFYASWQVARNLKLRTSFGLQRQDETMSRFKPGTVLATTTAFHSSATLDVTVDQGWLQENYFTYHLRSGKSSFEAIAGTALQSNDTENQAITLANLPDNVAIENNFPVGVDADRISTDVRQWRQASLFSRVQYNLADKYLITFNGRYDGNSKFGENRKWAFFPSGAVAWRVSEENFMKNLGMAGDLKLRLSYGVSGSEALGPYSSLGEMELDDVGYIIGDQPVRAYYASRLGNPQLRWERTVQFDAGFDISVLAGRLHFTADYFEKTTRDLFLDQRIPETSGVRSVIKNIGALKNSGVELSFTGRLATGALSWQISANAALLRSKVLRLDGRDEILTGYLSGGYNIPAVQIIRIGEPLGSFYGYRTDGVWQKSDPTHSVTQFGLPVQAGDLKIVDLNDDGKINDADRDIVGYAQPRLYGGITNAITYRHLDLSFLVNFVQGNHVFNGINLSLRNPANYSSKDTSMGRSWTPERQDTDIPRAGSYMPDQILDRLVEDASFVRMRELTLGYSLPATGLKKAGIEKLRFYTTGINLLTFTRYTGYDPEVSIAGGSIEVPNFDNGSYPRAKSVVLGLNLVF